MGDSAILLFCLVIAVLVAAVMGLQEVYRIAERKGLPSGKYLFMVLFFFPLGLACLIAAPDRPAQAED